MSFKNFIQQNIGSVRHSKAVVDDASNRCSDCNDNITFPEYINNSAHCDRCARAKGIKNKAENIDAKFKQGVINYLILKISEIGEKELISNPSMLQDDLKLKIKTKLAECHPKLEVEINFWTDKLIDEFYAERSRAISG